MDIVEGKVRCGVAKARPRGGLAKTALRASTLTALALLFALAMLLPNAAAEAQSSPTTATATATATPTDYDSDDDGLIDINNLAQLNAVRYDLNGDAKQGTVSAADWAIYTAAFSNPAAGMGCKPDDHDDDATTDTQPTCKGYELMRDLDFDTDGDGDVDSSDTYPNWTPIGAGASSFDSTLEGSLTGGVMPKISNLTINSSSSTEVGLFGTTSADARIKNVGLVDVNLRVNSSSSANIGALVGNNAGEVIACYSTGAIDATAGAGSYAGGLVGYNRGTTTDPATIAASFSRATVSMSIHAAATTRMDIIAGGLVGHNSNGTLTATYAAGAVRGKGDRDSGSRVGGLVGDNAGTIIASYSIAPVTSSASIATGSPPGVGGLTGHNDSSATITASYWDYITSDIPDDSGDAMPEGKSTHDLMSPTSATGIYVGWKNLTIDGAVAPAPWDFSRANQHPQLTYGGHTTDSSARQTQTSQYFQPSNIHSNFSYSQNTVLPKVGMTLRTIRWPYKSLRSRVRGGIMWESSPDGIDWTTLTPWPSENPAALRGAGGTYQFVPRDEHVGKYIRARTSYTFGYAYTRAIGKIHAAGPGVTADLGFTSGNAPPRVGASITAAVPSGVDRTNATGLWQRCDDNTATPQGCELVGSLLSYTPGATDLGHHLRAYIYYKNSSGNWVRASTGFTTQEVADVQRTPWR